MKNNNDLYDTIGKRLIELRKKAGYSNQESFAYEADIPRAQYGRYEKGVNMTLKSLNTILKFHKISFGEFFKEI
jgi:transcriptional regulator with XRE-family HTH domain